MRPQQELPGDLDVRPSGRSVMSASGSTAAASVERWQPAPSGSWPARRRARIAATSSNRDEDAQRVERLGAAGGRARLAWDSTPTARTVCAATGVTSERTSAADACAVYSRISAPESGPGVEREERRAGRSGSGRAGRSRARRSAPRTAPRAVRNPSIACASTAAWGLPFASATSSSDDQRVLAREVQLVRHDRSRRSAPPARRRRPAARRKGTDPARASRRRAPVDAVEQLAASAPRPRPGREAARGVHARVEHDRVGAGSLERQRRHRERASSGAPASSNSSAAWPMRDGVGAHEGEAVARAEATGVEAVRRQRLAAGTTSSPTQHSPSPTSASADLGERGQVAGAERAELARERDDTGAQRAHSASSSPSPRRRRRRRAGWRAPPSRRARPRGQRAPPPPAWLRSSRHWWSPRSSAAAGRAQRARRRCDAVERFAALEQRFDGRRAAALRSRAGGASSHRRALARDRDDRGRCEAVSVERDHVHGRSMPIVWARVIELTPPGLSPEDVVAVARTGAGGLSDEARAAMAASAAIVERSGRVR